MIKVLEALNKWQRREFDYGDADCCQFAAFVVRELTGKDYISTFDYASETQAYNIIDKHGDLTSTVSSVLGQPNTDFGAISDGSPVLVNYNDTELLGIKLGQIVVCLTKNGLAQLDKQYIQVGWPSCLK